MASESDFRELKSAREKVDAAMAALMKGEGTPKSVRDAYENYKKEVAKAFSGLGTKPR